MGIGNIYFNFSLCGCPGQTPQILDQTWSMATLLKAGCPAVLFSFSMSRSMRSCCSSGEKPNQFFETQIPNWLFYNAVYASSDYSFIQHKTLLMQDSIISLSNINFNFAICICYPVLSNPLDQT